VLLLNHPGYIPASVSHKSHAKNYSIHEPCSPLILKITPFAESVQLANKREFKQNKMLKMHPDNIYMTNKSIPSVATFYFCNILHSHFFTTCFSPPGHHHVNHKHSVLMLYKPFLLNGSVAPSLLQCIIYTSIRFTY
jgi:hypothetical protein